MLTGIPGEFKYLERDSWNRAGCQVAARDAGLSDQFPQTIKR